MSIANLDIMGGLLSGQPTKVHSVGSLLEATTLLSGDAGRKRLERALEASGLMFPVTTPGEIADEHGRSARSAVLDAVVGAARKKRQTVLFGSVRELAGTSFLCYHDARGGRRWARLPQVDRDSVTEALAALSVFEGRDVLLLPSGELTYLCRLIALDSGSSTLRNEGGLVRIGLEVFSHGLCEILWPRGGDAVNPALDRFSHLDRLEAESIHIIREVMAEADNPVMLYSVGKDSSVMLHLARKAFYPSPPPFPLLHVDTRWKFQSMYDFRDYMAEESGMDLLVHVNPDGVEKNINPLDHGSVLHTDVMKTEGLKQALDRYRFDVAFGGARRDEEKSRAKERVFSFRNRSHQWDPKNQRPELWDLYNGRKAPGESIRVFPISNWTELDIWQYIYREQIPIVPLYFAAERPVVRRDGTLVMVDDDRLRLHPGETIEIKRVRFRTLGCYPLTGAIESDADDLAGIILELLAARTSERQGRVIDTDSSASMEKKKQEGYF
jgi:sulfate adenylyltransferase subunit 2